MSKFGFDNDIDLGSLPTGKVRERRADLDKQMIEETERLGFKDRSGLKMKRNRKPGRKKTITDRAQVLITGPADVVDEFKEFCIKNGDVPYWEGLRILLKS